MFKFIEYIISPALAGQPFQIQIGMDGIDDTEIIVASLYIGNFNGDSKALHDIACCKISCCRLCITTCINAFGSSTHDTPVRDVRFMHMLTSALGSLTLDDFNKYCGTFKEMTKEEKTAYSARKKALKVLGTKHGVKPGTNNLILLLFKRLQEADIWCFYRALSIDYIHTLWKGLLEYVISWTLQFVHNISEHSVILFGDTRYSNAMALLDQRISEWTGCHESLQPVRQVKRKAVSDLLKFDGKTKSAMRKATGIMSGSIPAWELPGILLQLLFCIGTDGNIVPNFNVNYGTAEVPVQLNANVLITASNAGALEVAYFCESDRLTETQLKTFQTCVDNAHGAALDLFALKRKVSERVAYCNYLKRAGSRKMSREREKKNRAGAEEEDEDEEDEIFNSVSSDLKVIKLHLLGHIPEQIRQLGAHSRVFNSSIGEKSHQENVPGAFSRSSKNLETTLPEMCASILTREMGRRIVKLQGAVAPASVDVDQVVFRKMPTLGSIYLRLNESKLSRSDGKNIKIKHLHPLLKLNELLDVVKQNFVEEKRRERFDKCDEFFLDWYRKFVGSIDGAVTMRLVGGVKCLGNVGAGLKPCTFRANALFKGRGNPETSSVFSSAQINYESGEEFAKILAIVVLGSGIVDEECDEEEEEVEEIQQDQIYFVVASFERVTSRASKMSFEEYRLKANRSRTGGLHLDMVSVATIRPCFMQVTNREHECQEPNDHTFGGMIWSCIPLSRCVKADNCPYDTFVGSIPSSVFKLSEQIDEAMSSLSLGTMINPGQDSLHLETVLTGDVESEETNLSDTSNSSLAKSDNTDSSDSD